MEIKRKQVQVYLDKAGIKPNPVIRDKDHYIMIKGLLHQEI